jgi:carboxyl-terminal processing protease
MRSWTWAALWPLLALGCAPKTPPAAPPAAAPATPAELVEEVSGIVEHDFHSAPWLEQVGWKDSVARAREAVRRAPDRAARHAALRALMASLRTSHTGFYPREDPAYWALAAIFEPSLSRKCSGVRSPGFPVTRDDIGVFWKQVDGEWFAAGVYREGPAEKAGLKVGDQVVSADGRPFGPVESFGGKAGRAVALEVRRTRDGPPLQLQVVPRPTRPHDEFREATEASYQLLERRGRRFGYVHAWAWTTLEIHSVVQGAIQKANGAGADGFILDVRDGWGGADPAYLSMFFRQVPVLESVARDGKTTSFDRQLRKPAVLLVNGGTRSGKELIAYGARKHGLMRLVGERTAGAVAFGRPYCLGDGSLLWLAVMDARVDGERLEGRGVEPDVPVPFDVRYSAGEDPQLERALELLAGGP